MCVFSSLRIRAHRTCGSLGEIVLPDSLSDLPRIQYFEFGLLARGMTNVKHGQD